MCNLSCLFLGTGTSAGIPMIGCHCPVCTSRDLRDQRTRPSVVIDYDGKRILIDTTPELRLQCVANGVDWIDAVVYTHAHADHIMGLDDLRRFNAIRQGPLDLWADQNTHDALMRCFGYAFCEPNRDLKVFRPHLVHRLIDGPFEIHGRTWTPIPMEHGPKMGVLGFRIGDFAYCTDTSFIPPASYELLAGVETLVLDGLQWKGHPTHFSIDQAIEAAGKIGAKQTYLTHIAHGVGHAETSERLPAGVQLAHDGLKIQA